MHKPELRESGPHPSSPEVVAQAPSPENGQGSYYCAHCGQGYPVLDPRWIAVFFSSKAEGDPWDKRPLYVCSEECWEAYHWGEEPKAPEPLKEDTLLLVDGGAFAWTYGVKPWEAWYQIRSSYKNALICWDSTNSWRKDLLSHYKERRANRRAIDPLVQEKRAQVERFKAMVRSDRDIKGCYLDRFEADDLVAIHYLHAVEEGRVVRVHGVDKDLLQVPGLHATLHHFDGSPKEVALSELPRRAPKYWPGTRTERDLLLAQLLFGDRSDSIPRVLAQRDALTAQRAHKQENPFMWAYGQWGKVVIESLMLLVMPSPALHVRWTEITEDPEILLVQLDEGTYHKASNFPHICGS